MFAFLAGRRGEVFPDEDYADLFAPPGMGRPSLPTTQMASLGTEHGTGPTGAHAPGTVAAGGSGAATTRRG
jgi:hypothetical protein